MSTRLNQVSASDLEMLSPSPFVRKYSEEIVRAAGDMPILDVACGGMRNGLLLSYFGGHVLGVDIDLTQAQHNQTRLKGTEFENAFQRIKYLRCDLIRDPWPFEAQSIGGIINVHFLHEPLLISFSESMVPGGFLLLETVAAHGENFRQLPRAGALRLALEQNSFSQVFYQERQVGLSGVDAATVKLLAVKNAPGV
jgi:SAM-dependent methyltransferase